MKETGTLAIALDMGQLYSSFSLRPLLFFYPLSADGSWRDRRKQLRSSNVSNSMLQHHLCLSPGPPLYFSAFDVRLSSVPGTVFSVN